MYSRSATAPAIPLGSVGISKCRVPLVSSTRVHVAFSCLKSSNTSAGTKPVGTFLTWTERLVRPVTNSDRGENVSTRTAVASRKVNVNSTFFSKQ